MIGSVMNGFFETGEHFIYFGFRDGQRRAAGNGCPPVRYAGSGRAAGPVRLDGPRFFRKDQKTPFSFCRERVQQRRSIRGFGKFQSWDVPPIP